ncbi:protein SFI1 homolog isoform X7 [Hydra vulgaris]|uniref:Protein SFI1 homolog isoform X7 n=1 Tax=Hydra vulgaris TaxID=6087 RepID=A0ABM4BM15_HYDVU
MEKKDICKFKKRFIIRKCFSAWKFSVLGKITDFTVRNHYHRILLKKYILRWEKTLFCQREWKLNIRANFYHRFQIYQMTFKAWAKFVLARQKQKTATSTAYSFSRTRLLQQSFKTWRCYIQRSFIHCVKMKVIRFNLMRKYWHIWWNYYRSKSLISCKKYIALHRWADHMLVKAFFRWKDVYFKHCLLIKKLTLFNIYQDNKLMSIVFKKWNGYLAVQYEKKRLYDYAQVLYTHRLMKSSLKNWYMFYKFLQNLKKKELLIQIICKKFITRRYFLLLKSNVFLNKIRCKSIQLSCQQKTKKKVLFAFKRYVIITKEIKDNRWISKWDQKNEQKHYYLSQIANNYYRSRSLSLSFFFWMRFLKNQKKNKEKFKLAVFHYNKKLIFKLFINWFAFKTHYMAIKKMNKEALQFYRILVYSKVFYTWLKNYSIITHQDVLLKVALKFSRSQMAKYYFKFWKHKFKRKILLISFKKQADCHYILRIKSICYQQWKCRNRNTHIALSHFEYCIKRKCLLGLKKKHLYHKYKTNKERHAKSYYNSKIKYAFFKRWKDYIVCEVVKLQKANECFLVKATLLCSWVIFSWKEFYRISKHNKFQLDIADRHYRYQLSKKLFHSLRFYYLKCIQQKYLEEESFIRAKIKLDRGTLKSLFQKWRNSLIESKSGQTCISIRHYKWNLQHKVFRNLKMFKLFSQKIKLMKEMSSRFFMFCVCKKFYNIWLLKHLVYLANNKSTLCCQTDAVVFWWSIRLQKKVFIKWKKWVFFVRKNTNTFNDEINTKQIYLQSTQDRLMKKNTLEAWSFENSDLNQTKREFVKLENYIPIDFVASKNYRPIGFITSPSELRFNVNRPKPRIPNYLRESFDLNLFYGSHSV